jgi:hypothetical protein
MARTRVDLQPVKNLTGTTRQPGNEAVRVGHNRQGVAFINIFTAPTVAGTIAIDTATDANLGDGTGANFWNQVNSISTGTTSGTVVKLTLSDLGELIRWRYTAGNTTEFAFSVVVFLSDQ